MSRHESLSRETTKGSRVSRLLGCLALAAAAAIVFRGALAQFFSQDDFGWMARARGLLARPSGPWRILSLRLYWDLMRPFGMNALAYHLVSLAAHVATACLLFDFLRRRRSAAAAWLAAAWFAVHPSLYAALYWASALGDVMALGFALATLRAIESTRRRRWLAVPLFACSLMSKESTVLLPLWIALDRALPRPRESTAPPRRIFDPLLLTLGLVAVLHVAALLLQNVSGVRGGGSESSPYAMALDRTLWLNLLTYLGWTLNVFYPTVTAFSDAVDPTVFGWGVAALALWLAGLAWRRLRERGWLSGGALYALLLLPVIPLRSHTYHYYLDAPLAGAAWCIAALFDALVARAPAGAARRGGRQSPRALRVTPGWPIAAALGALLTANAALLVRKIETVPFLLPVLRADPIVDRARIARNVFDGLRVAALPARTRLIFWSPEALALQKRAGRDTLSESYFERNVRGALYGGIAVRVMAPEIDSVEFVRSFHAADATHRYALYGIDGRLEIYAPAVIDSALRAGSGS